MAKHKIAVEINLEPSLQTVVASKMILEMWVNADLRRNILVEKRYTDEGQEIYLELVREPDE